MRILDKIYDNALSRFELPSKAKWTGIAVLVSTLGVVLILGGTLGNLNYPFNISLLGTGTFGVTCGASGVSLIAISILLGKKRDDKAQVDGDGIKGDPLTQKLQLNFELISPDELLSAIESKDWAELNRQLEAKEYDFSGDKNLLFKVIKNHIPPESFQLLVTSAKADIFAVEDDSGDNLLHAAAKASNHKCFDYMIQNNIDSALANSEGNLPYQCAVDPETKSKLATIDALVYMVEHKNVEEVTFLAEKIQDLNFKGKNNKLPAEVIYSYDFSDEAKSIKAILRDKGALKPDDFDYKYGKEFLDCVKTKNWDSLKHIFDRGFNHSESFLTKKYTLAKAIKDGAPEMILAVFLKNSTQYEKANALQKCLNKLDLTLLSFLLENGLNADIALEFSPPIFFSFLLDYSGDDAGLLAVIDCFIKAHANITNCKRQFNILYQMMNRGRDIQVLEKLMQIGIDLNSLSDKNEKLIDKIKLEIREAPSSEKRVMWENYCQFFVKNGCQLID